MGGEVALTTVVIPVWDGYVQFLPEAIESVRRDDPEVPVVVVDNASTTPVPEFTGVEIVRSDERLTVGAARNLGLAQVRTANVIVLDADDMLLEGTLEFLQAQIEGDSSMAVCATSILEGDTGKRHRTPRRFVPGLSHWSRTFAFSHCIWSLYPIQGCTIMRTDQVRDAGGYADAHWGDDWVLSASLAFRGRVEVNRRLGLFYRPTEGSLWRTPKRPGELVASARLVRDRLRIDPGVPRWARASLPVIGMLQLAAVYLLRPLYLAFRALRAGLRRSDR
jgi:glycosyltransferase involved in cell wall biosynthesis